MILSFQDLHRICKLISLFLEMHATIIEMQLLSSHTCFMFLVCYELELYTISIFIKVYRFNLFSSNHPSQTPSSVVHPFWKKGLHGNIVKESELLALSKFHFYG
jgi:hypothetical protein